MRAQLRHACCADWRRRVESTATLGQHRGWPPRKDSDPRPHPPPRRLPVNLQPHPKDKTLTCTTTPNCTLPPTQSDPSYNQSLNDFRRAPPRSLRDLVVLPRAIHTSSKLTPRSRRYPPSPARRRPSYHSCHRHTSQHHAPSRT